MRYRYNSQIDLNNFLPFEIPPVMFLIPVSIFLFHLATLLFKIAHLHNFEKYSTKMRNYCMNVYLEQF